MLIPLLNSELLQNYRSTSVSEDCKRETFWTIIDALERALGGSGSVDMVVGGAIATTDDTDYSFKPPVETTPTTAPAPAFTPAVEPPANSDPGGGYGDGAGGYPSDYVDDLDPGFDDEYPGLDETPGGFGEEPTTDVPPGDVADPPKSGSEREEGREIAAGATGDSEDNAAAIAVGIVALLGALGLSMGDRIMGMRARRRII
ncbi:MAG: hypothetical protein M5U19_14700 [Microthrixaceae bacterium]|nr:hypothetical protein [Microthrixaceae bacterium]